MNDNNNQDPSYTGPPTQNSLGNPPTNAFTIDAVQVVEMARRVTAEDIQRAHRQTVVNRHLRTEFKMLKLEEKIIVGRAMLAKNEGDTGEIQTYVTNAGNVYNQFIANKLQFTHINEKNTRPPVLPLTFSAEETSELFWAHVNRGVIDSIADQIEGIFKANMERYQVILRQVKAEDCIHVARMIQTIATALVQWRPAAIAAVSERCDVIEAMIAQEERDLGRGNAAAEV